MTSTDYDGPLHRDYARGRALNADMYAVWTEAFAQHLPARRPLYGLDLGSGIGRFTPSLADAFGPVLGVEPSMPMRKVAETTASHPQVRYRRGSAEAIPATDESLDYGLMFLVWHHVDDPVLAAREIARVVRPGGILLCRTPFADQMPDLWWLRHFPGGAQADAAMFRTFAEEMAIFTAAGFEGASGPVRVDKPSHSTKKEELDRLRTRTLSVLHRMPDKDFAIGITSLEAEIARTPHEPAPEAPSTMMVLRKPS